MEAPSGVDFFRVARAQSPRRTIGSLARRMFTIVISEKGGAERREAFGQSEVIVGRAQGVDLRLDKGNVSKQHAKLAFKDGRFIVSDLKSTNGTWVNGKKISSATAVTKRLPARPSSANRVWRRRGSVADTGSTLRSGRCGRSTT